MLFSLNTCKVFSDYYSLLGLQLHREEGQTQQAGWPSQELLGGFRWARPARALTREEVLNWVFQAAQVTRCQVHGWGFFPSR